MEVELKSAYVPSLKHLAEMVGIVSFILDKSTRHPGKFECTVPFLDGPAMRAVHTVVSTRFEILKVELSPSPYLPLVSFTLDRKKVG